MQNIDPLRLFKFKQKEHLLTYCYSNIEIRYCKFTL